jgi:hypothetical protein
MPLNPARLALLLYLSPFIPSGLRAADAEADIPTVGRPADLPFSGASGQFRVSASAAPAVVEAQSPLTFVLRVEAISPVRQPPRRIDLREVPAFAGRFDFLEADNNGERRPNQQTWEFVYRIQPKRDDVTEAPGVPFVFFNPEIQYPRKGFQVAYTDPIPLTVRPHEVFPVPMDAPDNLFSLATGAGLLAPQHPWTAPGPWVMALLLLAPPSLCAAWYFAWRRVYPDAAGLARRRHSLAARKALQALRGSGRLPPSQQAARIAEVAADYLHGRCDAAAVEISPDEAADCLTRVGCSPALAERAAAFFSDCDAARFAPDGTPSIPDLSAAARRFILDVEAETWAASHSS